MLMRNVLFYFPETTQNRILQYAHAALNPDGFLLLGSSEQTRNENHWQPMIDEYACYYKPR
jgi:chemotaxis methyl-accepting protein methylase